MSRFIEVNITDETTPVSREGFGLGLILDPSTDYDYAEIRSGEDIPEDASELAEDMARRYLAQSPNPGVVAMAGKETFDGDNAEAVLNEGATDGEVHIEVDEDGDDGNNYTAEVVIDGTETPLSVELDDYTLTVNIATDNEGNATSTAAEVADEINLELGDTFTAEASGDGTAVLDTPETVEFEGGADGFSVPDALSELADEGYTDWYGLLLADRDQAEIEEAASWLTNELFITQPVEDSWAALDGYNLQGYGRVGAFPSKEEQALDAAIMSRMFATDPGTATWKWKQLEGVTTSGYPSADVTSMINPSEGEPAMNPMIWEMGVDYTAEGKAADGTYLDIQRAIDWMTARLTENIFQLLVTQGKVSYTNEGIAQVVARMREILQQAVSRDVLIEYSIDAPRREDVPTNDVANRILPDVNFEGIVSGAIHEVEVHGVLRV